MAQLIPALCKPVIPGDRFRVSAAFQMQLAPMINPVFDGLQVNFEAFFVPNRILDRRWREFWTGYNEYDQTTPTDIAPLKMRVRFVEGAPGSLEVDNQTGTGLGTSSLMDYLGYQFFTYFTNGLPYDLTGSLDGITEEFNALPVLAYNRIYDDWYRNERTQVGSLYNYYNNGAYLENRVINCDLAFNEASVTAVTSDVPIFIHTRNYAKDRFTTALPEPLVGGDVRIPIGEGTKDGDYFSNLTSQDFHPDALIHSKHYAAKELTFGDGLTFEVPLNQAGAGYKLNALALGTIQQLKFAFKEYEFRMKDTYNGNRYVESIESHYGVRVPDSTLQRSLYLGSTRDYVNFGEVYQTSAGFGPDSSEAPGALGDYAGRGNAQGQIFLFDETFYEAGYIMCIFSVSPKARYFQGVQRHLKRYERDDYFSPEYQNIGDDFIINDEIYHITGADNTNQGVFGYQTRWYDLKSSYDELHGDFARTYTSAEQEIVPSQMACWNFARIYQDTPTISDKFSKIQVQNRPFNSDLEYIDNYFVDIAWDIQALRPILATEQI